MHIHEHCLTDCRQLHSPNCNSRPDEVDISLIVIHGISLPPGEYGGPFIDQLFSNTLSPEDHPYFQKIFQLEVSSHLLIRRDGEVVQYVPFNQRAWHAGNSRYGKRDNCNDFAIGIELEGEDNTEYEDSQYRQLAEVTTLLRAAYPNINRDNECSNKEIMGDAKESDTSGGLIAEAHIVGHSHIAPDRKTDPGPSFDWERYQKLLDQCSRP